MEDFSSKEDKFEQWRYTQIEPADEIARRIEAHEKSLMAKLHELFGEES